jgi:alpha-tubulin suppressor-like RCC1 family protein
LLDSKYLKEEHIVRILSIILICSAACLGFGTKADKASGGEEHTLVGVTATDLWSCGNNSFSQLGIGDSNYRVELEQVFSGEQNLAPDTFLTDISYFDAGWKHSICCDSDGFCWTWGDDNHGQLGIGGSVGSSVPVQVSAGQQSDPNNPHGELENIIQVSAGRSGTHSLAIEVVVDPNTLEASYRAFSWGNNYSGQLGIASSGNVRSVPQLFLAGEQHNDPNGNPYFAGAIETSAGEFHSMLLDDSGNVFCMGDNTHGQLGGGSYVANNKIPVKVLSGEQSDTNTYLENIVAISAGWDHCMALEDSDSEDDTKNGRVYTWGSNLSSYHSTSGGKLGNLNADDSQSTPIIVSCGQQGIDPSGLVNIVAISAGESHCLALDNKGNVWSWGDNYYGQLGVGSQANHYTPVK